MVEKVRLRASGGTNTRDAQVDLDENETRREVRKAVSELPENLRMVIILKEYGDLDYKAIGKILGISESNVKVRVHRARKKLEESLAGDEAYVY